MLHIERTETVTRLVPWNTAGATGVLGEVELTSPLAHRVAHSKSEIIFVAGASFLIKTLLKALEG